MVQYKTHTHTHTHTHVCSSPVVTTDQASNGSTTGNREDDSRPLKHYSNGILPLTTSSQQTPVSQLTCSPEPP